jgi:hypothetical protein
MLLDPVPHSQYGYGYGYVSGTRTAKRMRIHAGRIRIHNTKRDFSVSETDTVTSLSLARIQKKHGLIAVT